MKIQIVGYGFVGQAHALALSNKHEICIFDPTKGYDDLRYDVDGIIICVSTPEAKDGSCDMSNVNEALENCQKNIPILIKSTISLEGWQEIKSKDENDMVSFSPEFLRAEHAYEDFKNQDVVYIGGGARYGFFWQSVLSSALGVTFVNKNPEALILSKYFRNSFLATKVTFFNQIFDLCELAGVDFNVVRELVTADNRIGSSHSYVTEERGFGGHCLPRDTKAILSTAEHFGGGLDVISAVVWDNVARTIKDR